MGIDKNSRDQESLLIAESGTRARFLFISDLRRIAHCAGLVVAALAW